MTIKVDPQFQRVQKAADDATYKNVRHAAFSLRKAAVASIKTSDEPSPEGSPVATRGKRGANVRTSIFVAADKDSAIIGPRHSFVGDVMEAHEFGKSRFGNKFKKRPTMAPALDASTDRFHADWAGSIGE